MIETKDVILFFDKLAPSWDSMEIRFNDVIDTILDNAGVTAGTSILDVACGTGILIPDYLKRGVEKVTAIDISPKMTEIAMNKFGNEDKVEIICGDVQNDDRLETYDRIVVYNAFPHFPDPDRLSATYRSDLRMTEL
jgi:demethylmenaquinone methyltransferase/2-methoxy-6-polyprenyl-1,4-benzoquinol methylase